VISYRLMVLCALAPSLLNCPPPRESFEEVWAHGTKVLGLGSVAEAASDPEPAGMV